MGSYEITQVLFVHVTASELNFSMSTSDYLTGSKGDCGWLVLLVQRKYKRGSSQTSSTVAQSQQRACDIFYMIHNSGFLQQQKEAMTMKNKKTKEN